MPVKQTQNGEVKVRNTTKLQLNSLDAFAKGLGYLRNNSNQYKPSPFLTEGSLKYPCLYKQKRCVSFNTMAKWHNGIFKRNGLFKSTIESLYEEGFPLSLYKKALDARKVKQVKIQRKKDTTLVVQDHLVEVIK